MLKFHHKGGVGDAATNIRMERPNGMRTMSITQIKARVEQFCMDYDDLRSEVRSEVCLLVG